MGSPATSAGQRMVCTLRTTHAHCQAATRDSSAKHAAHTWRRTASHAPSISSALASALAGWCTPTLPPAARPQALLAPPLPLPRPLLLLRLLVPLLLLLLPPWPSTT